MLKIRIGPALARQAAAIFKAADYLGIRCGRPYEIADDDLSEDLLACSDFCRGCWRDRFA
jgi:hypothetical protein